MCFAFVCLVFSIVCSKFVQGLFFLLFHRDRTRQDLAAPRKALNRTMLCLVPGATGWWGLALSQAHPSSTKGLTVHVDEFVVVAELDTSDDGLAQFLAPLAPLTSWQTRFYHILYTVWISMTWITNNISKRHRYRRRGMGCTAFHRDLWRLG